MNPTSGFRRVIGDIADLCELQIELLSVDGQVATRRGGIALVFLVGASVLALAAVVAAVFALAAMLYEYAQWTASNSLFAAAGIAAVICGLMVVVGVMMLKKAFAALEETRSEFAENMRWIKAAIVAPDTSPRAQVRDDSFGGRYTAASASRVR